MDLFGLRFWTCWIWFGTMVYWLLMICVMIITAVCCVVSESRIWIVIVWF